MADRLHGTENLLHRYLHDCFNDSDVFIDLFRACIGGDLVVVSELLKCGDRNPNAKNHDGQTALHLASFFGREDVLIELIRFGASVNDVDSSGYTPLHVAAQANQAGAIGILLRHGQANPVQKNRITGWLPLHEAAWKGHTECVRILLEYHSPLMPQTPKKETPSDLARSSDHHDLADFIDNYPLPVPRWTEDSLLHVGINRAKTLDMLMDQSDGTFLLRRSTKPNREHVIVLSMIHHKKVHHFEIIKLGIFFFMDESPYMPSLGHLVEHYSRFADGLPCPLVEPVVPAVPPKVAPRARNQAYPNNLRPIDAKQVYSNNDTLRRVRHSTDRIPVEAIEMGSIIGEGEFGSVFEGIYTDEDGKRKAVAVKVGGKREQELI